MRNKDEIKSSLTKVLFSLTDVPVLGPALIEVFDFRGKLKQTRLNQFTELLENYFSNHEGIQLESFQTVEFSDLFESVLKRVVLTSSIEKMRMFKDVLVSQIENPMKSVNESEIYLSLISELTEVEIKILFEYRQFIKSFQTEIDELNQLENKMRLFEKRTDKSSVSYNMELTGTRNEVGRKQKKINELQNIYKHDHFGISKDQFLFYKQRLFSKGLVVDNGIGSIGSKPFNIMAITQFGIHFIDYIVASR